MAVIMRCLLSLKREPRVELDAIVQLSFLFKQDHGHPSSSLVAASFQTESEGIHEGERQGKRGETVPAASGQAKKADERVVYNHR
jgi:hypothetical protein